MKKESSPSHPVEGDVAAARVSIVIPCSDDTFLPATLASLAGQKDAPAFEIVLVNACGTDLRHHLEPHGDRLDGRVVSAQRGASSSANRNTGVRASFGAFLLFLDADDTVSDTYVRAMTEALEAHELVCCSVDMLLLNPWNPGGTHPQQTGLITQEMSFLPFAGAGTLGIHRSLLERIGGWDTSLHFYAEADLCWRIQLAGYGPPTFVPGAILHYRLDPTLNGRWRRAVGFGRTESLLYKRFRHAGMRREPVRDAIGAWWAAICDVIRMTRGQHTEGILWRTAIRIGRLRGSLRYLVLYLSAGTARQRALNLMALRMSEHQSSSLSQRVSRAVRIEYPRTLYVLRDPRSVLLPSLPVTTGNWTLSLDGLVAKYLADGCILDWEPLVRWDKRVAEWMEARTRSVRDNGVGRGPASGSPSCPGRSGDLLCSHPSCACDRYGG